MCSWCNNNSRCHPICQVHESPVFDHIAHKVLDHVSYQSLLIDSRSLVIWVVYHTYPRCQVPRPTHKPIGTVVKRNRGPEHMSSYGLAPMCVLPIPLHFYFIIDKLWCQMRFFRGSLRSPYDSLSAKSTDTLLSRRKFFRRRFLLSRLSHLLFNMLLLYLI